MFLVFVPMPLVKRAQQKDDKTAGNITTSSGSKKYTNIQQQW